MNFINKVNKYLLEYYPLIWNTRLVWMIAINVVVHLFFFLVGYFSVGGLDDLKLHYSLDNFFFNTSVLYYNFLISLFILLIWIIFYLRNNAFKNLYRLPKGYLFKQFSIIFCIFFISITQYYSFRKGLILKVKSLYNWKEVDADIKKFNKAALFLIDSENEYDINKKKYPKPFPLKVAFTQKNNTEYEKVIDTTKAYINCKDSYYQFYKVDKEKLTAYKKNNPFIYGIQESDLKFRNVVDIAEFKEFINSSLYNYSRELFGFGQDSIAYQNQLKHHQNILDNRDSSAITDDIKMLIKLAQKYDLNHNLDVDTWFAMAYNPPNFLLKELINTSEPNHLGSFNNFNERYDDEILYSKTLYYSLGNLSNFFKNVHEAYFISSDYILFCFFIGFTFIMGLIFFIFKTTNVKSFLFTIVASIVVLTLIIWLMSFVQKISIIKDYLEFSVMLFVSFLIMLFAFVSYRTNMKKLVVSISFNLSLFAVPIFVLFLALSYIEYLSNIHKLKFPKDYNYKSEFEIWFTNYGFWAILLVAFIVVSLYSVYIRKLKARAN